MLLNCLGNRPKFLLSSLCLLTGKIAEAGRVLNGAEPFSVLPAEPRRAPRRWALQSIELAAN